MITLVCIAKWYADGYRNLIQDAIGKVDRIITVLDDNPDDGIEDYAAQWVEYIRHPLNKDFSVQRNFATSLVRHGWVLQLDTDETLSPELWSSLRFITTLKCDIVMLPRMNVMHNSDGTVSEGENWPDWQPKLHKPHVTWEHPVHEWPVMSALRVVYAPMSKRKCIVHSKDVHHQARIDSFFDTFDYHHELCARLSESR